MRRQLCAGALALCAASSASAAPAIDIASARASMAGEWEGSLEYLDYSANEWFGIPVKTRIEDQGDGATVIRKSDFDDGPKIGNVRITSVELFDSTKSTVAVGYFRKGKTASVDVYAVKLVGAATSATQWTMVEELKGQDDSRPANIRLTTVRIGVSLETTKQVDFLDDKKDEWISRNRTRLKRVGG